MKIWRCCAALLLVLTIGCIAPRKSSMPIGIFDPPASALPELAGAGFNLVVTACSEQALEAARGADLQVLMQGPATLTNNPGNQARLRSMDRHPATWGWYLSDEPDLNQLSPRRMTAENKGVKRFVRKPTVLVLSSGASVEKYTSIADMVAVDWYPVPWSSVGTVAREMRLARLGSDGKKFLAIIQAFDWRIAPNLLDTTVPLRAPTPAELRCMTYLALMQGASGILFYAYTCAGWNLESDRALKQAVLDTSSELRARESIFGKRVPWWPVDSETHSGGMFNEIGEARISMALFHAKKPAEGYYLLVANTTAESADFSFKLPFEGISQMPTSCDRDDFTVRGRWLRKTYTPFEVCILGPIKGVIADE